MHFIRFNDTTLDLGLLSLEATDWLASPENRGFTVASQLEDSEQRGPYDGMGVEENPVSEGYS
jgi:hypothetical protein